MGRSARAKLPLAATPLRQVMSKSIQRAIREHAAVVNVTGAGAIGRYSPISPLDLRMSPVIRRYQRETLKQQQRLHQQKSSSPDTPDSGHESVKTPLSVEEIPTKKPLSSGSRRKSDHFTDLETVYESTKNTEATKDECDNQNEINKHLEVNRISTNYSNEIIIKYSSHDTYEIKETPVGRNSTNTDGNLIVNDASASEVWYTPNEVMPVKDADTEEVCYFMMFLRIHGFRLKNIIFFRV